MFQILQEFTCEDPIGSLEWGANSVTILCVLPGIKIVQVTATPLHL